jgi:hypothetical protein
MHTMPAPCFRYQVTPAVELSNEPVGMAEVRKETNWNYQGSLCLSGTFSVSTVPCSFRALEYSTCGSCTSCDKALSWILMPRPCVWQRMQSDQKVAYARRCTRLTGSASLPNAGQSPYEQRQPVFKYASHHAIRQMITSFTQLPRD